MQSPEASREIGDSALPMLEKAPVLARCMQTRGGYYVIGWLHRVTGIGLVVALMVHLYARSSLPMPLAAWPILGFLAWVLSLGMAFHALNGGRLLLYELFGKRNDAALVRWTFLLSIAYAALLIPVMSADTRFVPPLFFWWTALAGGGVIAWVVLARLRRRRHSLLWKLERISGAFLFITVPVYVLFPCLDPGIARRPDASVRFIAFALAAAALYHAGYGLFSIVADYVPLGMMRRGLVALIVAVITALLYWAFRLTVFSL